MKTQQMTIILPCFFATYNESFDIWLFVYRKLAMILCFLHRFCVNQSNGCEDIHKCLLSTKSQHWTNHKVKVACLASLDSARIQESKKITLINYSQSYRHRNNFLLLGGAVMKQSLATIQPQISPI